ncbi:MAG: hypothetical protein HPKKFMNG_01326 [Planctomycetes bacterium]|nr:hypothetical protein [Planctomycetota bacterium]
MGDDHDAVDAQENGTADVAPVQGLDQAARHLAPAAVFVQARILGVTESLARDYVHHALGHLQHHVAGLSVADDDFDVALENVMAFAVACKGNVGAAQQFVGLTDQRASLTLLAAHRKQAHADLGVLGGSHNLAIEDLAHGGVLLEVGRLGIHIGADIHEYDAPADRGQVGEDARLDDAGQRAQNQRAGGDKAAGVARAHDGVSFAFSHQLAADAQRIVLLLAQCLDGMLVHVDDVRRMHHGDVGQSGPAFSEQRLDHGLLSDQQQRRIGVRLGKLVGAAHDDTRRVVTAHRIHGNTWHVLPFRLQRAGRKPPARRNNQQRQHAAAPALSD